MLADRLKMPVGEMLSRMSAEEKIEWRALFEVEDREREHQRKVQAQRRSRPRR